MPNYFQKVIEARRRQALLWPTIQTQPVAPVQVQNEGEPPKPPDIPEPSKPTPQGDMKNIANRVLAEGFDMPAQTPGTPEALQSTELSKSPQTSGDVGGLQSKLLQRRKTSPLMGGIV